jgi:RimJ/RimL family protein N-acetyltransferase
MSWTTTADPEAFLAAAGAFLHADPTRNSVVLTRVETMRERPAADALLGWWRPNGAVAGAFMHTPPYPAALTAMPPGAAAALADTLAALGRRLPGVNGNPAACDAFAAAWSARTGAHARVFRRMRLHRLDALVAPSPRSPGEPLVAGPEHRDLVVAWYEAFAAEIDEPVGDVRPQVDDRLAYGGVTLWIVDGAPVSLAGVTRTVAGMARVAPVYTPPERRGRGYGAAATAAVTRAALDAGVRDLLLYTDLANPTSNRLYARLGYRPVEDSVVLLFDGGA